MTAEWYRQAGRYDIVVFQKAMRPACVEEAQRLKAAGVRVVFDANVNYYEAWGDFFIPGTRPTAQQTHDATAMTSLADLVIADSTYLYNQAAKLNPNVVCIPDYVDLKRFPQQKKHAQTESVQLVWSGIAKKCAHLLSIAEPLASVKARLLIVSDEEPSAVRDLSRVVPITFRKYSDRTYPRLLLQSDVIISPKQLCNSYEMAHTELKITLGMAAGLPAIASPQLSYVEAIQHNGGGIIAESAADWAAALLRLTTDAQARAELGARARETVAQEYSKQVITGRFAAALRGLLDRGFLGAGLPER